MAERPRRYRNKLGRFVPGDPDLRVEIVTPDQTPTQTFGDLDKILIHDYTKRGMTEEQALEAIRKAGGLPSEVNKVSPDVWVPRPEKMVRVTRTRPINPPLKP